MKIYSLGQNPKQKNAQPCRGSIFQNFFKLHNYITYDNGYVVVIRYEVHKTNSKEMFANTNLTFVKQDCKMNAAESRTTKIEQFDLSNLQKTTPPLIIRASLSVQLEKRTASKTTIEKCCWIMEVSQYRFVRCQINSSTRTG